MTRFQRLSKVLKGIGLICASILIMILGRDGYRLVLDILAITFIITGLKYVVYYFQMARHMVGGKMFMFIGILYLDFGMFTLTLHGSPIVLVVLYLVAIYLFSGLVDILRALEARRMKGSWKLTMSKGLVNFIVALTAVLGGLVFKVPTIVVELYGLGLIYSGVMEIAGGLRNTAMVYIQ